MGASALEGPVLKSHLPMPGHQPRGVARRPTGLVVRGCLPMVGLGRPKGQAPSFPRHGAAQQASQALAAGSGLSRGTQTPEPAAVSGHFTEQPGGGQKHLWPHLRPGGGHAESGAVSRPVPRPRQAAPALRVPASLQGGVRSCGWVPGSDTADPGLHRGDGRGAWVPVQGPLAPDITRLPH